jgi:hypothetical protein
MSKYFPEALPGFHPERSQHVPVRAPRARWDWVNQTMLGCSCVWCRKGPRHAAQMIRLPRRSKRCGVRYGAAPLDPQARRSS